MTNLNPVATLWYFDDKGRGCATVLDIPQAMTMAGILEQTPERRIECARQLARCLDVLIARHKGHEWMRQPVMVNLVRPNGLVESSPAPLPARAAKFAFFACCSRNLPAIEQVVRELREFVAARAPRRIGAFGATQQHPERIVLPPSQAAQTVT